MIPKVIHQFWDRPVPPDDVAACIQTWRDHHPGWTHILWNDESALSFIHARFGLRAARCFAASTISAMRADILRVAALLAIGGVYADADTECLSAVDLLVKRGDGCVLHVKNQRRFWLRTSLMLAEPGHHLMRRFHDSMIAAIEDPATTDLTPLPNDVILDHSGPTGELWRRIWMTTGPGALNRHWQELGESERASVRVLRPARANAHYRNIRDLAYRKEGHWMDQGKVQPIVDFTKAARIDKQERARRARAAAEVAAAQASSPAPAPPGPPMTAPPTGAGPTPPTP